MTRITGRDYENWAVFEGVERLQQGSASWRGSLRFEAADGAGRHQAAGAEPELRRPNGPARHACTPAASGGGDQTQEHDRHHCDRIVLDIRNRRIDARPDLPDPTAEHPRA